MNSITSFFSSIRKQLSYGPRIRPGRDWFVLLSVFFACLLCSFAWNLWLFSKVTNGQAIGSAVSATSTPTLNLNSVNALFDARSAERARYQSQYHFVDPSV
jgi:hypothetical protein